MNKSNNNTTIWLLILIAVICLIAYLNHQGTIHLPTKINLPNVQVSGIRGYIAQTFGIFAGQALSVAQCESSMNPSAYNPEPVYDGEHAEGLFQIIPSTFARVSAGNVYNYQDNTDAAHAIFMQDGDSWREWACKP